MRELADTRKRRNNAKVQESLSNLEEACKDGTNVMELLVEAMKAEVTLGEANDVMREAFGTWMAPSGV